MSYLIKDYYEVHAEAHAAHNQTLRRSFLAKSINSCKHVVNFNSGGSWLPAVLIAGFERVLPTV